MSGEAPVLGRFVLRTILWLAPCFAAWFFAAPHHAAVAGESARLLLGVIAPRTVAAIERTGSELVFVTTIEMRPAPGERGALLAEVNPLQYTYGLALFAALMLASRARGWKLLAGAALLLPFQAWGIAFDFLAQLGITLGPEVAGRAGLAGWRLEAIALGYQVGALLFPALVPIALWAALDRRFLEAALSRPGAGYRGESPLSSR